MERQAVNPSDVFVGQFHTWQNAHFPKNLSQRGFDSDWHPCGYLGGNLWLVAQHVFSGKVLIYQFWKSLHDFPDFVSFIAVVLLAFKKVL